MISFERYAGLFRVPGMAATMIASIVGRIPIGMTGLAILVFVQGKSGSFSQAGAASALYVLGLAVVAPFLGRLIDRVGPRMVLAACSVLYPMALFTLVFLVSRAAHPLWVGSCAFAAGAALPPITVCMRSLYPRVLGDVDLLHTAYSVDSALIEIIFVVGPALIAAFVAVGYVDGAILLAATCAAIGGVVFLRSPTVRNWMPRAAGATRGKSGPLRCPGLLKVFAATLLYSMAFGLFEVAVTAYAAQQGMPAAAGVALALASVGSAAGALVYGSRSWPLPLHRQFLMALVSMAFGILLLVPVSNVYAFVLISVLAGAPMATVIAAQSILVSRFAPRDMLAEAFTWSATCLLAGISAGIAAGGLLAEHIAPSLVMAAAASTTAAAGAVVWLALSGDG